MNDFEKMADSLGAMERDFAVLLALLAAHYPATLYSEFSAYRTVNVELPNGVVSWPINERDADLFSDLELSRDTLAPQHTAYQRETLVLHHARTLIAARPKVPCPEVVSDKLGKVVLTCDLARHASGNHKTPDGREWWVGRIKPS